jgi:pseudaminic acid biosynthesis-associated methylase
LHGIEIQKHIVEQARENLSFATVLEGSALQIPFEDGSFDLVFTSGVLIHIAPKDLPLAMSEIHRTAKSWIWGLEYYSPEIVEVAYRGQDNLLWKADYVRLYQHAFSDLELVREERLPYVQDKNIDTMYLLRRR